MLVAEGDHHPKNTSAKFTIVTKSKGFVIGETQLVALAQGVNRNTSEFSSPALIESPKLNSGLSPSGLEEGLEEDRTAEEVPEESEDMEYDEDMDSSDLPKPRIKRQTHRPTLSA